MDEFTNCNKSSRPKLMGINACMTCIKRLLKSTCNVLQVTQIPLMLVLLLYTTLVDGSYNTWSKVHLAGGCKDDELDRSIEVLKLCNPKLADVSSAILMLLDQNYTHVCRCLSEYVKCMEPTFICKEIVSKEFWKNYNIYAAPPYYCTVDNKTVLPAKYEYNGDNFELGADNYWSSQNASNTICISMNNLLSLLLFPVIAAFISRKIS